MNAQTQLAPYDIDRDPFLVTARTAAAETLEVVEHYEIDSRDMFLAAGEELRAISARRKDLEAKRVEITKPMDLAKQRVMDLFRSVTDVLDRAEQKLRGAMVSYETAERQRAEQARREAEAKARAEREAAERDAREAEQRAAEAARQAANAETPLQAAAAEAEFMAASEAAIAAHTIAETAAIAPVVSLVPEAPKAAGVSFRSNWKAEVTDLAALIAEAAGNKERVSLLKADESALNALAKATKGAVHIPGVRFYDDRITSVRRA